MENSEYQERLGDMVILNGGFVIIDHPNKKEFGDRISYSVVHIWSLNEEARRREIELFLKTIHSGNGSKVDVSQTKFCSSSIISLNNEDLLKRHKDRTMVVVHNLESNEYFLVMDDDQNIKNGLDFVRRVSTNERDLIEKLGCFCIKIPTFEHRPSFEVVLNAGLIYIKLEALSL